MTVEAGGLPDLDAIGEFSLIGGGGGVGFIGYGAVTVGGGGPAGFVVTG